MITARIAKRGKHLIKHIKRGDRTLVSEGHLVNITQDQAPDPEQAWISRDRYISEVDEVTLEQDGPVRAVVRIEGHRKHWGWGKSWLPFTVRLYFYAGAESFRMVHTFVYDSDGSESFIAGLGVRFKVELSDELYDRHVRFVGEGHGQLTEAVKGITGLRRDPGHEPRAAQIAGEALPDPATWDQRVTSRLHWIPAWGDYSLSQLNSEGYAVRKRTKSGHGWVPVDQGRRASGFGYVGGPAGGFAFGMKDFWQRHPTGLDIRDAHTDSATVTVWMWSPEAQPMDTRFYHDGMGQDTYEKQLDALNVTYEDYEPGFGTPYGVARTSELQFWVTEATPTAERLGHMADVVRAQPQVIAPTEHLAAAGPSAACSGRSTARTRSRPRSRTCSTSSSTTTRPSATSVTGTASGTTATSCTPRTATGRSGATTWAATPGTTPRSRRTCGCGRPTCTPTGPTSSGSPRRWRARPARSTSTTSVSGPGSARGTASSTGATRPSRSGSRTPTTAGTSTT
ncbi:hypothetical protein GCM10029992_17150 [Glycomyces albus]